MKEVQLTQGQVALVDDEDYEWLNQWKWCAQYSKGAHSYYAVRKINGETIGMHRVILGIIDAILGDHINHDTLDNGRSNLRLCTRTCNQANARIRTDNTSGYKGVSQIKASGLWESKLRVNNKWMWLGSYIHPQDAARAYDAAAIKYFGTFALTNAMLGTLV